MNNNNLINQTLKKSQAFFFQMNSQLAPKKIVFPNNGEKLSLTLKRSIEEKIEILHEIKVVLVSSKIKYFDELYNDYCDILHLVQEPIMNYSMELQRKREIYTMSGFQEIWQLSTKMHEGQKYGGAEEGQQIDYINHITSVAYEVIICCLLDKSMNAELAVKCALLHDTLEDTELKYEDIIDKFGKEVADGVLALTKNKEIEDKELKMLDSLRRIKQQPKEIWAVKMADRIANLFAPPYYWNNDKKVSYVNEAKLILKELGEGNKVLATRLEKAIEVYKKYLM